MRRRFGLLRVLAVMLAAIALHGVAWAGDAQLARQLTDRGIELQKSGDHARAVTLFDAALAEIDHPKIRYFRAKSLRALGRFDEASTEFDAIKDQPEVGKYREEILAFINDIAGEKERAELQAKLDAERRAREALEAERTALAEQAEQAAVERLRSRPTGLLPPVALRPKEGAPNERIVPLVPAFAEPTGDYPGALEALRFTEQLDDYETDLTIAKAFTVAAVVGLSVGVGLGANPAGDGDAADGVRQAGLAVGVVGLMSGLVAAVLWPDEPTDTRPPLDASEPSAPLPMPTSTARRPPGPADRPQP